MLTRFNVVNFGKGCTSIQKQRPQWSQGPGASGGAREHRAARGGAGGPRGPARREAHGRLPGPRAREHEAEGGARRGPRRGGVEARGAPRRGRLPRSQLAESIQMYFLLHVLFFTANVAMFMFKFSVFFGISRTFSEIQC